MDARRGRANVPTSLGKSDVADLASLTSTAKANVSSMGCWIYPVLVVEVDVIRTESPQ